MNKENELKILDRINEYADVVLKDMELEATPISIQLEKLKPEMEKISSEYSLSLEDIFVMYMDLNLKNQKMQEDELNLKINSIK